MADDIEGERPRIHSNADLVVDGVGVDRTLRYAHIMKHNGPLDIITGGRAGLVRRQKEALVRFVCSADEPQARAAMKEVTSIGQRLRLRGALTLVPDETGKTRG